MIELGIARYYIFKITDRNVTTLAQLAAWRKQIWKLYDRRYPGKKMKPASRYKKWLEGGVGAGFGRAYLARWGCTLV